MLSKLMDGGTRHDELKGNAKLDWFSTRPPLIGAAIRKQGEELAAERGLPIDVPDEGSPLAQSGLDSLFFAILVTRLEERLGLDPFTSLDEFDFPLTLGDFIRCYELAATKNQHRITDDPDPF